MALSPDELEAALGELRAIRRALQHNMWNGFLRSAPFQGKRKTVLGHVTELLFDMEALHPSSRAVSTGGDEPPVEASPHRTACWALDRFQSLRRLAEGRVSAAMARKIEKVDRGLSELRAKTLHVDRYRPAAERRAAFWRN